MIKPCGRSLNENSCGYNSGTFNCFSAAFNSKMTYPCKYPFVLKSGNGGEFEAAQEWVSYFHDGSKKVMRGSSVSAAITSGLCSLGRAFDQSLTKEKFLSVISPKDVFFEQNNKKQVNVNL